MLKNVQKTKGAESAQTTTAPVSAAAPSHTPAKAQQTASKPAGVKPAGAKPAEGDENFDYSDFEIEDESI